jgi:hypothetical protein
MSSGILNSMSRRGWLHFLTLVSFFIATLAAHATPHFESPMPVTNDSTSTHEPKPEAVENFSLTPAPATQIGKMVTRFNKANYFYPFHKEIAVHAGVVFGLQDSSDDDDLMNYLIGFRYVLPRPVAPRWEAGADLSTVGHGHVYVSKKFIHNEKGSFRPYYSLGVLHKFVPDEKFASLSNSDNYLARAAIGLADIVKHPKSVQVELALAAGIEDILVLFSYGYTWGF